jgi:hypothetical protein
MAVASLGNYGCIVASGPYDIPKQSLLEARFDFKEKELIRQLDLGVMRLVYHRS